MIGLRITLVDIVLRSTTSLDYQISNYYQANYSYNTYKYSYYQQSTFDTLGQYRLLTLSSNGTDHIHNGYICCFHQYTILRNKQSYQNLFWSLCLGVGP